MPLGDKSGKPLIHLNNSASSLMDPKVYQAVIDYMNKEVSLGTVEAKNRSAGEFARIYERVSALVGVPIPQIALFTSCTEAWQKPFYSIPLNPGDKILVGESEWGGNLSTLKHRCDSVGAIIEVVPSAGNGMIDPAALANRLDKDVIAVCVSWMAAVTGAINPMDEIAAVLEGSRAWLFVDAAQSFGQVSIDLSNPRFDVVSVSPRKYLRAPRGAAFATFSARFLDEVTPFCVDQISAPWVDDGLSLHPNARKFEFAEVSYAVRMGFGQATDLACEIDWPAVFSRIRQLASDLRTGLRSIPGIHVQDEGTNLGGIVTFSSDRKAPYEYLTYLTEKQINVAAPSAPYAPLWFGAGRPSICRLSPHYFNTEHEISAALEAIEACSAI